MPIIPSSYEVRREKEYEQRMERYIRRTGPNNPKFGSYRSHLWSVLTQQLITSFLREVRLGRIPDPFPKVRETAKHFHAVTIGDWSYMNLRIFIDAYTGIKNFREVAYEHQIPFNQIHHAAHDGAELIVDTYAVGEFKGDELLDWAVEVCNL